jgi:PAS domain S-box-containing protein
MNILGPLKADLKYQMLTESSQEIILFFDHSGKIIDYNKAALEELGYGEDITKWTISEIFRKAFKIENDDQLNIKPKFLNKTIETVAYRKNQTCFTVNLKTVIKKDRKSFLGLCTAMNITDKKDAIRSLRHFKNEARNFNKAKDEFVANMAHELRTPVNGILGLSEYLLDTELSPKQVDTLHIIKRSCTNMNAIINDFLDYAKITNRRMVLEQREFNFRNCIKNIIEINITKISEKGLKLLVNIADDIPDLLVGDELRLTQIINNLLSNAIKFTSAGQITLEVAKTAEADHFVELFFMVIDTGIGISNQEKDKLFHSFTQVDGSITRRFGGTGLGLSISKKLVEAMNGTITVDSEKFKGSTFSFTIRLGIGDGMQAEKDNQEEKELSYFELNDTRTFHEKEFSKLPEVGYIRQMVNETMLTTDKIKEEMDKLASWLPNNMESSLKELMNAIDKLSICIEMESWSKAEDLADHIKKLIPPKHEGFDKDIFRLVLAVRKEDHDTAIEIINKVKLLICEVMAWTK